MKNVTFTTRRSLSRRTFLKGTGVALALPWLDAMHAALAAEPVAPRRFIGILNYFSFHAPYLFPAEQGTDYTPTTYLELLGEHRRDFSLISGLNHPEVRDGHASDKSFFTGAPHPASPSFRNTVSLDQLAASRIGRSTRFASLNFSTSGNYSCSYTPSGVAVPPETSAARMLPASLSTALPQRSPRRSPASAKASRSSTASPVRRDNFSAMSALPIARNSTSISRACASWRCA